MSNFDDLRRQAEESLGKETVQRLERELSSKANEKSDEIDTRHMVSAEKVDFRAAAAIAKSFLQEGAKENSSAFVPERNSAKPAREAEVSAPAEPNANRPSVPKFTSEQSAQRANAASPTVDVQGTTNQRSHSAELLSIAIKGEYRYGMLGLLLGLSCVLGGIVLGLNGVAGSTSWTANLLGLESRINDAAPGVVLFVVGIFLVWITKPKVKLKELQG